ncbi:hypothetical protein FD51_GL002219 [Lacticaseibacillus zeae DSM 20178 = KCTC 3804]|uniref:Uncharacterized protein n=1 Tax=Lacticaseibacillus zeae DSM 20178 = KCTC 3804 TaxID=1423816 RepID=A0A0R1EZ30_LACZE|nr:hypothetical protein FD51_GL002219 [Lacticaseibacillus zeae DSM 20178 = KCTC 3804]
MQLTPIFWRDRRGAILKIVIIQMIYESKYVLLVFTRLTLAKLKRALIIGWEGG